MSQGARTDNLRALRLAAGLSLTELAQRANVSDRTILVLEDGGSASYDVVQRLADALGVSTTELGKANLTR